MKKIIGICGSPRTNSNSTQMLETVLDGTKSSGAEVEKIIISDLDLKYCTGCLKCDQTGICNINDGMNEINEKLASADGLVIATPSRFDNVSPQLKNFMDRTNPLTKDMKIKGKKVVLLTSGYWPEESSRQMVLTNLKNFCDAHEMEIVGTQIFFEKTGQPNMVKANPEVLEKCYELGKKLCQQT